MKRLANEAEVRTAIGLRKLVLLAWTDSNMHERWTWDIFLTERSDGSLSTGARQFGEGLPTGRILGTYRIRTGAALRDGISSRETAIGTDRHQRMTNNYFFGPARDRVSEIRKTFDKLKRPAYN